MMALALGYAFGAKYIAAIHRRAVPGAVAGHCADDLRQRLSLLLAVWAGGAPILPGRSATRCCI